jgi:hypothetical protein
MQAPMQGFHFPPPDAQPAYGGYSNPQALPQQQWPPHGEPQPYEINYQAYGDNDPPPFQHGGQAQQHHGYDSDAEFSDGYYEDEEPRRGKRWLLIAAALVGAIGVGGALAYTYRSLVAPKSRMEAVKTEPGVKVKVGSKEDRPPLKVAEEAPAKVAAVESPTQDDPPPGGGDSQAPRKIKTITISPGGGPQGAPEAPPTTAPSAIPGITLYEPPPKGSPAPSAKDIKAKEPQPPPSSRVAIGTPPPLPPPTKAAKEVEEEPPVAEPPVKKQAAVVAPKAPPIAPPPRAKEAPSGSGLGFVAVLKSEKTSMDAMKTYADLQQTYPDVLGGKSFDVQAADLSARGLGTMYRVVVGPPGSHNAASAVCAQLKAAGYVGCWVKEY